jgi:LysR family transcriptional regulator, glycine cleavage system transcriptional activator
MTYKLPSFKALEAFEAAARLKSVSAAAEELFVTPGAVSRQITSLEDWIDQRLMHRSPQGVSLTVRGEKLARSLGSTFEIISNAVREAMRQDDNKIVTISVYPTFAIQWLMPRLAEFHAAYPDLDLRIKTSLQEPNFNNDDIDIAVIVTEETPPGLSGIPLFEREFSPVCSPAVLARHQGIPIRETLKNERLLLSDMHMEIWIRWLKLLDISDEILKKGVRFENSVLAWQAARNGAGFAMGQTALLEAYLSDGHLVKPFEETILDKRLYCLVCRENEKNLSSIDAIFSWFKNEKNRHS